MKKICLPVFVGLCVMPLFAGDSVQKVLARYYENMKRITSIQAGMVMEIKRGDDYSYMKGEYASKGIKMSLRVPPPFDFLLVSNGKRAYFYSKPENTVYFYAPDQYPSEYANPVESQKQSLDMLSELKPLSRGRIGWKTMQIYEGVPNDPNQFISKIRLWVDDGTGLLYRTESFDLHGALVSRLEMQQYRKIGGIWFNLKMVNWSKADRIVVESATEYHDVKINPPLEDSFFEFAVPSGAKVKDMTAMIQKKTENK